MELAKTPRPVRMRAAELAAEAKAIEDTFPKARYVEVYPCCDGAGLHRVKCLYYESRERIQSKVAILGLVKSGKRAVWFGYRDALEGVLA